MIKFAHTNIITDDWRRLADFYITVFDCKPLYPERDLRGEWLDRATAIKDANLRGIHLKLPGYDESLPTLEIFQYNHNEDGLKPMANRKGYGHIAFRVDDVASILKRVLENGGSRVGELVETEVSELGTLSFVYARDIDGNIIELQNWH
jgi:catechol 2,3-dioxygenase-like lactoylglutathione lyase family enzyme